MEIIGNIFEDYKIIIYYDNSNDNSLNVLKEYKTKNIKMDYHLNNDPLSNLRTHNIAKGRNFCLNYIREKCNNYDFFIMMDCDDVNSKNIKLDTLNKYLLRSDWDSLSFNTMPTYYDIWALSIKPYYLSIFHWNNKTDEMSKVMSTHIKNIIDNTPEGSLINCASAFNGFSIYKTDKFINCSYDGQLRLDNFPFKSVFNKNNIFNTTFNYSNNEDCEHRNFHFQAILINNAKIRISPEILFHD
jgi:hypothetical protein